MHGFALLSVLIWLPIVAGVVVLALGERSHRRWALGGAARAACSLPASRCRCARASTPARRHCSSSRSCPGFRASTPSTRSASTASRCRWCVLTTFMTMPVVIAGWTVIDAAPGAVLRRLPDHGRADGRRVLRHRCAAVLLLLGSDADPDVPHHRHLGRSAARVRHHQVLPVHLPGLRAACWRRSSTCTSSGQTTRSRPCRRCR